MKLNQRIQRVLIGAFGVALSSLVLASIAGAGQQIPLRITTEFEGHYYVKFTQLQTIPWLEAREFAAIKFVELPDGTILKGHLVTITSQAEQDFVSSTFLKQNFNRIWLGAYQFSTDSEPTVPAGNWAWITGEEIGNPLTNWGFHFMGTGEPGNSVQFGEERVLWMEINDAQGFPTGTGNDRWHDVPIWFQGTAWSQGILVEFDSFGDNFADLDRPPVVVSGSQWRSNDVLVAGWENLGFNDSAWSFARSPYPSSPGAGPTTLIPGTNAEYMWHDPLGTSFGLTGSNEAFFRYTFNLDLPTLVLLVDAHALISVDDDYDFYVNGELVFENHDGGNVTVVDNVDITTYLRYGENVIAIHAQDGYIWGIPEDRLFERVLVDLHMEIF